MKVEVYADPAAVARCAADFIAAEARAAVAARGKFMFAVSGGHTPWMMLAELAKQDVSWKDTHLFQIDERVAPDGDPARNLTHLRDSLLALAPLPSENLHAMPVGESDLENAARHYAQSLREVAGDPPVLDLAHLGLGPDGHTASLVPNDAVLAVTDRDVAVTGVYQEHRRMTLTYPMINRARRIAWLITGSDKVGMLQRLLAADPSIPSGRIRQDNAIVIADLTASPSAP
jgi:6-phosphogluconolactonase